MVFPFRHSIVGEVPVSVENYWKKCRLYQKAKKRRNFKYRSPEMFNFRRVFLLGGTSTETFFQTVHVLRPWTTSKLFFDLQENFSVDESNYLRNLRQKDTEKAALTGKFLPNARKRNSPLKNAVAWKDRPMQAKNVNGKRI